MGFFDGFDDVLDVVKDLRSINSVGDIIDIGVDFVFGGPRERFVGDTRRTMLGGFQPRRIIYGERLVSGHLVNAATPSSNRNDDLYLYFVLAAQESDDVLEVYADGELVGTSRKGFGWAERDFDIMPGWYADTESTRIYYLSASQARGASGQTMSMRQHMSGNGRGSYYTGCFNGHTVVHIHLRFNVDRFKSGIPDFTFKVRGKTVYDPRTATTAYSNNYALCVLDWMRTQMAIPDAEIDMYSFADAADVCDESVTIPEYRVGISTEYRYRVNGILELNKTPLENLQRLMMAGNAWLSYTQGKWRIHMPTYTAPVMTLTESDLIGGIRFSPSTGKQKRLNTIRSSYIDPFQDWTRVESPVMKVPAYITNDKETLEGSVDFEMVTSPYQAQRLCKQILEASRYGTFVIATFKFKALELTVGDRVALTIPDLTWSEKVFRIYDVEMDIERGVTLTLREDAAEIYDWDIGDALVVASPDPILLPDVTDVGIPESIVVEESIYAGSIPSDFKTRITITWEPPIYEHGVEGTPTAGDLIDQRTFKYDLEYKESAESVWNQVVWAYPDLTTAINDAAPGTYDFRVRAVNVAGYSSEWLTITNRQILGKTAPPPNVESLFLTSGYLVWTYPTPPADLLGFQVRMHQGNRTTWDDAAVMFLNYGTTAQVFVEPWLSGTKTFLVKALDTSGNFSTNHASIVFTSTGTVDENVILTENQAPGWTGTLSGGTVNLSDQIEADHISNFYNPVTGQLFYSAYGASDFYSDSRYERVTYLFSYEVDALDVGCRLSVTADVNHALSHQIDYIPPSSTASYVPFPGTIPFAEVGIYDFRLTIPEQFDVLQPTVDDIILTLDVPDIVEDLQDVSISSSGTRLPITRTYRGINTVTLTLLTDGSGAVSLKVDDKDHVDGPLVYAYNSAGTAVATTIDAIIRGY